MNLYRIFRDDCDYDEYDEFIIYADTEDEVRMFAKARAYDTYPKSTYRERIEKDPQGWDKATIELVEEEEGIVIGSFRAG